MSFQETPNLKLRKTDRLVSNDKERSDDIDATYDILDAHNHDEGNPVPWNSGLDKSTDLDMIQRAILNGKQIQFVSNAGDTTDNVIKVINNELYFRDAIGNETKITDEGRLNVTGVAGIVNISGMASLRFDGASETFIFTGTDGTARANLAVQSIQFANSAGTTSAILTAPASGTGSSIALPGGGGTLAVDTAQQFTNPVVGAGTALTLDFAKPVNGLTITGETTYNFTGKIAGRTSEFIFTNSTTSAQTLIFAGSETVIGAPLPTEIGPSDIIRFTLTYTGSIINRTDGLDINSPATPTITTVMPFTRDADTTDNVTGMTVEDGSGATSAAITVDTTSKITGTTNSYALTYTGTGTSEANVNLPVFSAKQGRVTLTVAYIRDTNTSSTSSMRFVLEDTNGSVERGSTLVTGISDSIPGSVTVTGIIPAATSTLRVVVYCNATETGTIKFYFDDIATVERDVIVDFAKPVNRLTLTSDTSINFTNLSKGRGTRVILDGTLATELTWIIPSLKGEIPERLIDANIDLYYDGTNIWSAFPPAAGAIERETEQLTPGTYSWVSPVESIRLTASGGGGGGGGGSGTANVFIYAGAGGAGGGGGAYGLDVLVTGMTIGETYTIVVGAGGAGGAASATSNPSGAGDGVAGGDTTMTGTFYGVAAQTITIAGGGLGNSGNFSTSLAGGTGGSITGVLIDGDTATAAKTGSDGATSIASTGGSSSTGGNAVFRVYSYTFNNAKITGTAGATDANASGPAGGGGYSYASGGDPGGGASNALGGGGGGGGGGWAPGTNGGARAGSGTGGAGGNGGIKIAYISASESEISS